MTFMLQPHTCQHSHVSRQTHDFTLIVTVSGQRSEISNILIIFSNENYQKKFPSFCENKTQNLFVCVASKGLS